MLLNVIGEFFDALIVFRRMEENEERKTLLRQLLRILESDFSDQGSTFVGGPDTDLIVAEREQN